MRGLWVPLPPSTYHAMAGATVICNPSASVETTTKESYRRSSVSNQSARLLAAYVYADAGEGESTQDVVYSGHHIICENGSVLAEAKRFTNEIIYADIDVQKLAAERRKMTSFPGGNAKDYEDYTEEVFSLKVKENKITRTFPKAPFVPDNQDERDKRCDEILSLQSMGLKKRLEHTNCGTRSRRNLRWIGFHISSLSYSKSFRFVRYSKRKSDLCDNAML